MGQHREAFEGVDAVQTIGIRDLSAPVIAAAADRDELIGITNGRVLAGVLLPFSTSYVQQLVEQNITRVLRNVARGEGELDRAMKSPNPGNSPDQFVTLEDMTGRLAPKSDEFDLATMRRVSLREINGSLLEKAAELNQTIAVTADRVIAGVIFPVSRRLVTQLVENNLSRVLHNIELGEKELSTGRPLTTLDDIDSRSAESTQPQLATG